MYIYLSLIISFPNSSLRICSIKPKISMLYYMNNIFRCLLDIFGRAFKPSAHFYDLIFDESLCIVFLISIVEIN